MSRSVKGIMRSFVYVVCFAISGCDKPALTYEYLMTHPDVLQLEIRNCQNEVTTSAISCEVVQQAANDFYVLAEGRSNDPELFGQKIQEAQSVLATLTEPGAQKIQQQKIDTLYAVIRATSRVGG